MLLFIGVLVLFSGVLIMLLVGLGFIGEGTAGVRRRVAPYSVTGPDPDGTGVTAARRRVARSALELADRAVQHRDPQERLATSLEAAGIGMRPAEWMTLHIAIATGCGLLLGLLSSGRFIAILAGLVLGVAGPWLYLSRRQSHRREAFHDQLPDTLQLVAGSLSAGYSIAQAVDTVVREGNQPIAGEFSRALVDARLGVPLEDALDTVATRMGSRDFHWAVLAMRIQREVGGNLAEVLGNVSTTLRERARLQRQARVLSAEGRLSAWVISGLPVAFVLYLILVQPQYLEPLYTTPLGVLMLCTCGVLFLVGLFWVRRVVRVEP